MIIKRKNKSKSPGHETQHPGEKKRTEDLRFEPLPGVEPEEEEDE